MNKEKSKCSQQQGLWALHIDMEMATAFWMKSLIRHTLKSPQFKNYTNLPLLLVSLLTKKMPQSDQDDIHHARAQHQLAQLALCKHFSMKICSLDHPLASLDNATLHSLLMAVTASDGKKLFLSVEDPSWNGQGYNITFLVKYQIGTQDFVKYLPKYLQHAHGDAVFCWFTFDAIEEAKVMGWNKALQQPISQDGINL